VIVRLMGEGQFDVDDEVAKGLNDPDEHLDPSDTIIPPDDLSLEEARRLFEDEGLIPDLPRA